ncbi:hypothetical protein [Muriicola soli]|uniref:DUF3887 domain-containing protein n=1 Tax=Muriicola soli TaxID=2507538 RepID=A0A411E674_9FLAO|nr:hypothetical protein [Muriicola soli]QBA63128.1 hypothetical protein EQY75_00250 [Muriicola soli]
MRNKLLLISSLLLLLGHLRANAQNEHQIITDEFFRRYETDPLEAMDFAFTTNKWLNRNRIAIEQLKNNFKELRPQLGEYFGFEKLKESQITDRLRLATFMVRYDRQPLRFTFILYKPNDFWRVHNLKYDDSLVEDLENMLRE